MAYDNNTQKQKESMLAVLRGIMNGISKVGSNLTTEGEEEGSSVSVFERIAVALETIAERLNPLYTADYVEPDPDAEPDPEPSDNQGEA